MELVKLCPKCGSVKERKRATYCDRCLISHVKIQKRKYNKKWYYENKERCKEHKKECNKRYHQENKESQKDWRLKNKERIKEYQREYYQENKERFREQGKEYRKTHRYRNRREYTLKYEYGLTSPQVNEILVNQDHRCLICGKSLDKTKNCIDHDHKTEKIRGILCAGCNIGLTYIEDAEFCKKATEYLLLF